MRGDLNSLRASNEEKRASKDPEEAVLGVNVADFGMLSGNDSHIRLDATGADRQSVVDSPAMGWPIF